MDTTRVKVHSESSHPGKGWQDYRRNTARVLPVSDIHLVGVIFVGIPNQKIRHLSARIHRLIVVYMARCRFSASTFQGNLICKILVSNWLYCLGSLVIMDRRRKLNKSLYRRLCEVASLIVFAAILCGEVSIRADTGPQPPCGSATFPPYPDLEDSPAVRAWEHAESGRDWTPPACIGWTDPGFTTLVVTVAHFRHASGVEGLLRRIGAISELAGMRYWSNHSQAMADAYHQRLRFVGGGRRSTSPGLLPSRNGGRQESILSTGG